MKVRLFLLGLAGAALVACGDDKYLLVGVERGNVGGAASAGSGGAGAMGGTSGASGSGGSSGTGGSGAGSGGMGSGPGPGPGPDPGPEACLDMAREYRSILRSAQICMPPDPMDPQATDPCTLRMPDDPLCRCPTYVNPDRFLDIPYLEYLLAETAVCPPTCQPNTCRPVGSGACLLDQNLSPPRPHCFAMP